MCTTTTEEKCETQYETVYEEVCEPGQEVCQPVTTEQCNSVTEQQCNIVTEQECEDRQCTTTMEQKCETEYMTKVASNDINKTYFGLARIYPILVSAICCLTVATVRGAVPERDGGGVQ